MIAHLGMYDMPHLRAQTDALWVGVRDRLRAAGVAAPESLARGVWSVEGWLAPDIVLSQACGLPFARHLRGRVQIVGAADHGLPGVPAGCYRSHVVVRSDDPARSVADLRGRLAINDGGSQSGAGVWRAAFAGRRMPFDAIVSTGAHRQSAAALRAGDADVAAIDAVTWHLLPAAEREGLRIVASTPPTPGGPYICALGQPVGTIRDALAGAIADLPAASRTALHLHGIVPRAEADFDGIAATDAARPDPLAHRGHDERPGADAPGLGLAPGDQAIS